MTKIVLDSNFIRKGRFSVRDLKGLAGAIQQSAEIFVPIVIVWEWAEHAASDIAELAAMHRTRHVEPEIFAVEPLPERPTKDELVETMIALIPRGITVWYPQPDAYRDAVKSQVLQTGVAERKSKVKTGAADHLVLECVRAQVHERCSAEAVHLATGDKRLRSLCKAEFDEEVMVASNRHDLLLGLTEFRPAESELAEVVEQELSGWFLSELGEFSMGFEISNRPRPLLRTESQTAVMRDVSVAEIHDLDIGQITGGARVGTAQFRVHGDLELIHHELQEEEDGFGWWTEIESHLLTMVVVHVEVDLTFDEEWSIANAVVTKSAAIELDI